MPRWPGCWRSTRVWPRCWRLPGARRCAVVRAASRGLPRSSWRNNSPPRAPGRSGDGSRPRSTRSTTRPCCARGRTSSGASDCRRRRSAPSRRSRGPSGRAGSTLRASPSCRPTRTADIYLLSCVGHADAWPAGDLALQEAARLAFALDARPTTREMGPIAEAWRPWRGVAAWLLWTYYRAVKGRDAAPVQPET